MKRNNVKHNMDFRKLCKLRAVFSSCCWRWWFCNAVSILECIIANVRVVGEWWLEKDFKGSGHGLIEVLTQCLLEGLRKPITTFSRYSWCPSQYSHWALPKLQPRAVFPNLYFAYPWGSVWECCVIANKLTSQYICCHSSVVNFIHCAITLWSCTVLVQKNTNLSPGTHCCAHSLCNSLVLGDNGWNYYPMKLLLFC
jgi:hypothetical protein